MEFLESDPILDTLHLGKTGPFDNSAAQWHCYLLARMLKNNRTLKRLDLHGNSIDSNGGIIIAQSLCSNMALMELSVLENPFSADVAPVFAKAMMLVPNRIILVEWL